MVLYPVPNEGTQATDTSRFHGCAKCPSYLLRLHSPAPARNRRYAGHVGEKFWWISFPKVASRSLCNDRGRRRRRAGNDSPRRSRWLGFALHGKFRHSSSRLSWSARIVDVAIWAWG